MLKFRVTNSTKARRAAEAQRKALEEKLQMEWAWKPMAAMMNDAQSDLVYWIPPLYSSNLLAAAAAAAATPQSRRASAVAAAAASQSRRASAVAIPQPRRSSLPRSYVSGVPTPPRRPSLTRTTLTRPYGGSSQRKRRLAQRRPKMSLGNITPTEINVVPPPPEVHCRACEHEAEITASGNDTDTDSGMHEAAAHELPGFPLQQHSHDPHHPPHYSSQPHHDHQAPHDPQQEQQMPPPYSQDHMSHMQDHQQMSSGYSQEHQIQGYPQDHQAPGYSQEHQVPGTYPQEHQVPGTYPQEHQVPGTYQQEHQVPSTYQQEHQVPDIVRRHSEPVNKPKSAPTLLRLLEKVSQIHSVPFKAGTSKNKNKAKNFFSRDAETRCYGSKKIKRPSVKVYNAPSRMSSRRSKSSQEEDPRFFVSLDQQAGIPPIPTPVAAAAAEAAKGPQAGASKTPRKSLSGDTFESRHAHLQMVLRLLSQLYQDKVGRQDTEIKMLKTRVQTQDKHLKKMANLLLQLREDVAKLKSFHQPQHQQQQQQQQQVPRDPSQVTAKDQTTTTLLSIKSSCNSPSLSIRSTPSPRHSPRASPSPRSPHLPTGRYGRPTFHTFRPGTSSPSCNSPLRSTPSPRPSPRASPIPPSPDTGPPTPKISPGQQHGNITKGENINTP
ncbi:hypothetical protein E2C01_031794 [Portunus trituberculatus]|uniref:Uncharacterized protein n=1 Tax=Portunus trituberculatus TaxID=210409 RepID=A0A5B7EZ52_PORTR|nr:hypothetical protein [Portunus trituberculatus]